jgi:hypothetical protein
MTRAALLCAATILTAAAAVDAHALDEYVQALRVAVSAGRVDLSLDLTPGVKIAGDVLRRVDTDGDGSLSPDEAERYARVVLADLTVTIDGNPVAPALDRVDVSTVAELRDGVGTIRVRASAPGPRWPGRHHVDVRNRHLPSTSVYLANALLPESANVRIEQQSRDRRQQDFLLEYAIGKNVAAPALWVAIASLGLIVFVRVRS